jgi:hypothetical protein
MILDDIFEAIKPSDIPTSMRSNRLTMRDIEAERPQGAYRFRVGDKEFMSKDAADEFARGTGDKVEPIGQPAVSRGSQARFRVIDPRSNRPAATFPDEFSAQRYATTVNGRVEAIRETVKKKLTQSPSDLDEISNPFQQPAPIRSIDPMPPVVDPAVPPQYANYQSRRARAMAGYAPVTPAAVPTPTAAEPQDNGKSVDFGRMVSQLAAPQGTKTSTGGTVQPTKTGLIHKAKSPPSATKQQPATQTFAKSDRPAWLGKPITMGDQVIKPTDPNYKKIADALLKQGITEKKKPVPTNKPLWGRAKAAARAKFDVYPSAYANAWAAKWYKSHGGGWRMGKGAKK